MIAQLDTHRVSDINVDKFFYGDYPPRLQLKNAHIIHFVGGIKPR